jgi:hypothetical protein
MKAKTVSRAGKSEVSAKMVGETSEKTLAAAPLRRATVAAASVASVLCVAVYLLRLDRAVGLTIDDAWYVLLGKALATGQGYTLINSPTAGIVPFYPPGFPFLLSLVFRLAPDFPQNVWLLKGVSVAAMLGAGAVCYYYFTRHRGVSHLYAAMIALVTVLNPAWVFLATSAVMSECVFLLLQLLAVVFVERAVSEGGRAAVWRYAAVGGALAGAAYLTRSAGVTLIAGALIYFVKERRWRLGAAFALTVAALVGPWALYARQHAPTQAQRDEQNCYIVFPYSEQLWMKKAGDRESGFVTLADLPARALNNGLNIIGRDAGKLLFPIFYRSTGSSGQEIFRLANAPAWLTPLSWLLFALIAAGFVVAALERITLAEIVIPVALAITVLWPWETIRFVMPFLPFGVFYLARGLQLLGRLGPQANAKPGMKGALAVAVCVAVLYVCDHIGYIAAKFSSSPERTPAWLKAHRANEAALNWMSENLRQGGGAITTVNPALVYLRTGIKTVGASSIADRWNLWKQMNVRYFAYVGRPTIFPAPGLEEAPFRIVYQSNPMTFAASEFSQALRNNPFAARAGLSKQPTEQGYNLRVLDLGPPATRPQWGSTGAPIPNEILNSGS